MLKQQQKLAKGDFTLDDFRKQFDMLAKMGPMGDLLKAMPGGFSQMIPEGEDPEQAIKRIRGMIDSMTKEEKRNPDTIDINRRRRIASGSGTEPHEVKQFLGQFEQVRVVMRQIANMSFMDRIKMMTGLGKQASLSPGGMLPKQKIGTGHRKSPKERAKRTQGEEEEEVRKLQIEDFRLQICNLGSSICNLQSSICNRRVVVAVRIRMKMMGRKHRQYFRIVAIDSRQPRDGRVIEELGSYDPQVKDTNEPRQAQAGSHQVLDVGRALPAVGKGAGVPQKVHEEVRGAGGPGQSAGTGSARPDGVASCFASMC